MTSAELIAASRKAATDVVPPDDYELHKALNAELRAMLHDELVALVVDKAVQLLAENPRTEA